MQLLRVTKGAVSGALLLLLLIAAGTAQANAVAWSSAPDGSPLNYKSHIVDDVECRVYLVGPWEGFVQLKIPFSDVIIRQGNAFHADARLECHPDAYLWYQSSTLVLEAKKKRLYAKWDQLAKVEGRLGSGGKGGSGRFGPVASSASLYSFCEDLILKRQQARAKLTYHFWLQSGKTKTMREVTGSIGYLYGGYTRCPKRTGP